MFRSGSELLFFTDRLFDHFASRDLQRSQALFAYLSHHHTQQQQQQEDNAPSSVLTSSSLSDSSPLLLSERSFGYLWEALFGSAPSASTWIALRTAIATSLITTKMTTEGSTEEEEQREHTEAGGGRTERFMQSSTSSQCISREIVRKLVLDQHQSHAVLPSACSAEPHWAMFDAVDAQSSGSISAAMLKAAEVRVEAVLPGAARVAVGPNQTTDWDAVVRVIGREGRVLPNDVRRAITIASSS